jgi:chemotaxis protein CheZ
MTGEGLPAAPQPRQASADVAEIRDRLDYVVRTSGEAVDRVLNSVDQARAEQEQIASALRELRAAAAGLSLEPVVDRLSGLIEASSGRTRDQLTDILLAQSFHDLISQVVAKTGPVVTRLEEHLGLPPGAAAQNSPDADTRTSSELSGPVIGALRQGEVLTDQDEVDALLAKSGF